MSRKGFLVVSGCPRSGTSVNMDIQRAVHGDNAICGEKFPQERIEIERMEGEPLHIWQCRKYFERKRILIEEATKPKQERDFKNMNPEGFWEMAFTVPGIAPYRMRRNAQPIYSPQLKSLMDRSREEFLVVKVVSQGLLPSDPRYIGKVIFSIRHPRAVAKSQEKLIRGFNYVDEEGEVHNSFEGMVIHTPEMFISTTESVVRFLLANPSIPVWFLHFEELIKNPREVIDGIGNFVGVGDYKKAYDVVKPSLNRSQHEDIESSLWDDAEFVYDKLCKSAEIMNECVGDNPARVISYRKKAEPELKAILEYLSDPRRNINREKRHWKCYRAKRTVNEVLCRGCMENPSLRNNFKDHSERVESKDGVTKHWSQEPCVFECGMDIDREDYLTIQESIDNNFWLDNG